MGQGAPLFVVRVLPAGWSMLTRWAALMFQLPCIPDENRSICGPQQGDLRLDYLNGSNVDDLHVGVFRKLGWLGPEAAVSRQRDRDDGRERRGDLHIQLRGVAAAWRAGNSNGD